MLAMGAAAMGAASRRSVAAPAAQGFGQRLAIVSESENLSGLHALLVSRHGNIVFEHYGSGEDESEGRGGLGVVAFAPDVPHDLRSVSKSVVGLLYGVALAEGNVPPPEATLLSQFPEYADLASQPGRDRLTIAHVLSMTMGLEWDEFTVPYGRPGNGEFDMDAAQDRYRYILSRPIANEPGTKWVYCGGATALLGHLIERGTGQTLLGYARRVLFEPMNFGPSSWSKDHGGELRAASGLRLLPRDMLKIGQLVLANGVWQGRQLVPTEWIRKATTAAVRIDANRDYGLHWFLGEVRAPGKTQAYRWLGGIGWGGQFLFVLRDLDLAVAMNCGNYTRSVREQARVAFTILAGVVLPLVVS
jgi:CubicO group peptidase (beta-lactamase class C family)